MRKWNYNDNVYSLSRKHMNTTFVSPAPSNVSPEIVSFRNGNTKRETYLYNNRLAYMGNGSGKIVSTGFMTPEQHDINHKWISTTK